MDIISHTLTGVAVGTVAATISKKSWKRKVFIILIGGLGGALPDFDAISLWSKFDVTIGSFLGLNHTGKEIYFGKFWYSHHAMFHSIVTPLIFISLFLLFNSIIHKNRNIAQLKATVSKYKHEICAFFFGFLFHLFEDMPTPACVWGGVNLFFPSAAYVGGFGKIWWWNNYDIVLIIVGVISINILLNLIYKIPEHVKIKGSIAVFTLGLVLSLIQMNTRSVDFSYTGHTVNYHKLEAESKRIQKEILGEKIFNIMTEIDRKIPLNF